MKTFTKRIISILAVTLLLICSSTLSITTTPVVVMADSVTASVGEPYFSGDSSSGIYGVYGNVALYYKVVNTRYKRVAITGCITNVANTTITIPSSFTIDNISYRVTEIANNAFTNQVNIKSVVAEDTFTKIGQNAFKDCSNLTSFTVNTNPVSANSTYTTVIANSAFENCKNLRTFNVTHVSQIGDSAFRNCIVLNNLNFMHVESLGTYSFLNCYRITQLDFSNSVFTTIPQGCFSYTTDLTCIKLPSTVTTIGEGAFSSCHSLNLIYLPDSVTYIGKRAFACSQELETVLMSENIQTIDELAFNECPSIKYFVCKNPTVTIGQYSIGYNQNVKVQNIVIWGKGGNIQTYAQNCGFTYHNVSEAVSLAQSDLTDHIWNITNTKENFNNGTANKYYINDQHAVYDKLGVRNKTWTTSDYGLAALTALSKNGDIDIKRVTNKTCTKIPQIKGNLLTANIKSLVNTLYSTSQDTNYYDYYSRYSFSDKEMNRYIEYITYGAKVGLVSYLYDVCDSYNMSRLAYVCYGLEWKEYASDKNSSVWTYDGHEMNARILMYRPGQLPGLSNYIYINTETGEWHSAVTNHYGYHINNSFSGKDAIFYLSYSPDNMLVSSDGEDLITGADLIDELCY